MVFGLDRPKRPHEAIAGAGMDVQQKRIWGWFFFDWASQPFNTLLLTFIFGPYVVSVLGDGSAAQTVWGYGVGIAGLLIAVLSPLLGAIADRSGRRMPFIWLFSLMYVAGSAMLWQAAPDSFNIGWVMLWFCIGLIGMEFATTFTNAMLPDLAPNDQIGRISGSGWAFGYVGGIVSLLIMLLFLAEGETGRTLIGLQPAFGLLDETTREGTRSVGPLVAIWYAVFMIPFFLWVRETRRPDAMPMRQAMRGVWPELKQSLKTLPKRRSLAAYLASSMFYRDALNGMYSFGGIYAAGVLGWSVTLVGVFGVLAALTGAIFAWLGGRADQRFGPKPVIVVSVIVLLAVAVSILFTSRTQVLGLAVAEGSILPDVAFFVIGALIGAAGGSVQASSRTLLVRQASAEKMTEAFGLYALAGKATSFMAPLGIGIVTGLTGSQQWGVSPLILLFLVGLILLFWVKPEGESI